MISFFIYDSSKLRYLIKRVTTFLVTPKIIINIKFILHFQEMKVLFS